MHHTTSLTTPIFGLRREIDRLFEDAFSGRGDRSTWAPVVNVREAPNELVFEFELPGVKPDEVEITTDNGILTVRGERRHERKEGEEGQYHIIERVYGAFSRSFQLPHGVDEDQISADYEDGVLGVHVPKAAIPKPKRIEVKAGRQSGDGQAPRVTGSGRGAADGKRGGSGGERERSEMAAKGNER